MGGGGVGGGGVAGGGVGGGGVGVGAGGDSACVCGSGDGAMMLQVDMQWLWRYGRAVAVKWICNSCKVDMQ